METPGEAESRAELLRNIRRLVSVVLDRLEEGSQEHTLDQGQVRLLGNVALRSLRLWSQVLLGKKASEKETLEVRLAEERLTDPLEEPRQGRVKLEE